MTRRAPVPDSSGSDWIRRKSISRRFRPKTPPRLYISIKTYFDRETRHGTRSYLAVARFVLYLTDRIMHYGVSYSRKKSIHERPFFCFCFIN